MVKSHKKSPPAIANKKGTATKAASPAKKVGGARKPARKVGGVRKTVPKKYVSHGKPRIVAPKKKTVGGARKPVPKNNVGHGKARRK